MKYMLFENPQFQRVNALQVGRTCALLNKAHQLTFKDCVLPMQKTPDQNWTQCLSEIANNADKSAFKALFQHFAPRLKSFMMKAGAHEDLAEECVQETMAAVWHKSGQFDPTRATASTWIFTIARNKRIDALRKERRPEPDELHWGPEADPAPEDILALEQETQLLTKAVADLPAKQMDLIKRAFYGDLSHQEIAQETGLPLGTIKSRIRLALEKLRHSMT